MGTTPRWLPCAQASRFYALSSTSIKLSRRASIQHCWQRSRPAATSHKATTRRERSVPSLLAPRRSNLTTRPLLNLTTSQTRRARARAGGVTFAALSSLVTSPYDSQNTTPPSPHKQRLRCHLFHDSERARHLYYDRHSISTTSACEPPILPHKRRLRVSAYGAYTTNAAPFKAQSELARLATLQEQGRQGFGQDYIQKMPTGPYTSCKGVGAEILRKQHLFHALGAYIFDQPDQPHLRRLT
jgi:hypothetical protein